MSDLPEINDTQPEPAPVPVGKPSQAPLDLTPFFLLAAVALVVGTIVCHWRIGYSVNDWSRLNTIYYLVEHGTYEFLPDHGTEWEGGSGDFRWYGGREVDPDKVNPAEREKLIKIGDKYYKEPADMPLFWTIDMVRIGGKYYSSKPPLLPTCMAGVALLVEKVTGADLRLHPKFVIRTMLIITQVLPFIVFILLIRSHIHRFSESPFVRNFCIGAACLATYLTPWTITLNNHTIAACTAMIAIHAAIRIWYDGKRQWYLFAIAGFFSTFTAAIELPAGLLVVGLFIVLLIKDRKRTLLVGVIAGLIPTVAAMYTNYLVTDSVLPAYLQFGETGGWYDYPGSYWNKVEGIDALDEPKPRYLMHMLIGHHGVFLLTPIFLLSAVGIIRNFRRKPDRYLQLAVFVALLTVALVTFYTFKTANYGGWCQGFRWLFWMIPLWLLFLPAGVELFSRNRVGRSFCYVLLAVSLFSTASALRFPWMQSWAHLLFKDYFKWINY